MRPRTTVANKIKNGTYRPDRDRAVPVGEDVTSLPQSTSTPLDDVGRYYFDTIGNHAISLGILESQDLTALEELAFNWSRKWECENRITELRGEIDKQFKIVRESKLDKDTFKIELDLLKSLQSEMRQTSKQSNDYYGRVTKGMVSFGMSPIDRQKIEMDKLKIESDPLKELLNNE